MDHVIGCFGPTPASEEEIQTEPAAAKDQGIGASRARAAYTAIQKQNQASTPILAKLANAGLPA